MARFRKYDWIVMAVTANLQATTTHPWRAAMFHPALSLPQSQAALRSAAHPLPLRIVATLVLWARRHRGRAELRELDDHILRDIGQRLGVVSGEDN